MSFIRWLWTDAVSFCYPPVSCRHAKLGFGPDSNSIFKRQTWDYYASFHQGYLSTLPTSRVFPIKRISLGHLNYSQCCPLNYRAILCVFQGLAWLCWAPVWSHSAKTVTRMNIRINTPRNPSVSANRTVTQVSQQNIMNQNFIILYEDFSFMWPNLHLSVYFSLRQEL